MRPAARALQAAMVLGGLAACGGGCANVIGLDGLDYDREGEGGAAGALATTSATASTADASSATATATAAETSSAAQTSSTGAGATTSGTGGEGPVEFPVTGTADDYLSLLQFYDLHFYRFDENSDDAPALNSTQSASELEGFYIEAGEDDLIFGVPGVFPDDDAVTFTKRGYMNVIDFSYPFAFSEDEAAFTVSFFAQRDAEPTDDILVARCFDPDLDYGWKVIWRPEGMVLERDGLDENGDPAHEETPPIPVPADGSYHLVTLQKLSRGNDLKIPRQPLRGFRDGIIKFSDATTPVVEIPPHECLLEVGNRADGEHEDEPVTLDELVLVPYGLNDAQLAVQITCLLGGSCAPP